MQFPRLLAGSMLLIASASLLAVAQTPVGGSASINLSDLDLSRVQQGYGAAHRDLSVDGTPLLMGGRTFAHGIGTHANSAFRVGLDKSALSVSGWCGLDDDSAKSLTASIQFEIVVDGISKWKSPILRGGDKPVAFEVPLQGAKTVSFLVNDAGDGITSDHADWGDVQIKYNGKAPRALMDEKTESLLAQLPAYKEAPGGPPNSAANLDFKSKAGLLDVRYANKSLLSAKLPAAQVTQQVQQGETPAGTTITQHFAVQVTKGPLRFTIEAGTEAIAAETRGSAQTRFPLIRTSHGLSRSLRNNAIYDRDADWMLEFPAGSVIVPSHKTDGSTHFQVDIPAKRADIYFRPRYYQKHRNLPYFQPWTYAVRKDSITGWCSWWAYFRNFNEGDLDKVLDVWKQKRLGDYGYKWIQIDDAYQGGDDADMQLPDGAMRNYMGGRPQTWLNWKRDQFPDGGKGYADKVKGAGLEPAIWVGSFYNERITPQQHPDWFVQGADGKPYLGAWVSYDINALNPTARETLLAPTYRGLHEDGFRYFKIDQLRHYLYDNLNHNLDFCIKNHVRPDEIFRAYLGTARHEIGRDSFLLSCWGVLPEAIGLADAMRLGGDGYGPVTMQQYNSFNGIVWRSDPDHCDVFPKYKPAEAGNVLKTQTVQTTNSDTIIRPALASIAGSMLMLSDKPEVYSDDANLLGLRRAAPVVFSVPGQLYDFDPQKTDALQQLERATIQSGSAPAPTDADQFGTVCPWWLNEFDAANDHWNVLHHLNWSDNEMAATTVNFADLGLDPAKTYLVYEFWTNQFLGQCKGSFSIPALDAKGLQSFAIREALPRPQLVSTNRHLSQGAVDLETMTWTPATSTLSGTSHVIAGDQYTITLHVPVGFTLSSAKFGAEAARIEQNRTLVRLSFLPEKTQSIAWKAAFKSR